MRSTRRLTDKASPQLTALLQSAALHIKSRLNFWRQIIDERTETSGAEEKVLTFVAVPSRERGNYWSFSGSFTHYRRTGISQTRCLPESRFTITSQCFTYCCFHLAPSLCRSYPNSSSCRAAWWSRRFLLISQSPWRHRASRFQRFSWEIRSLRVAAEVSSVGSR